MRRPAGSNGLTAAHMRLMPKKMTPEPIRPALLGPLSDLLSDRGPDTRLWPAGEAAVYRDSGGFQAGQEAVRLARLAKAAEAVEEIISAAVHAAERTAYLDGVSAAQAMTGFTDETFRSIVAKDGIDLDGGASS